MALSCRCGFTCDFLWMEYCVTSAPIVVPMSNIVALFRVHLPASKSPWTNVTAADFEATLLSLGLIGEHAAAAPPRLYSARVTGCCRPPRQRPRPLACGDCSSFLRVVARPSQGNKSRELDFQAIGAGKYTVNKANIAIRTTGSLSRARRARRMRAPLSPPLWSSCKWFGLTGPGPMQGEARHNRRRGGLERCNVVPHGPAQRRAWSINQSIICSEWF